MLKKIIFVFSIFVFPACFAQTFAERSDVQAYINELVQQHHFDRQYLSQIFSQVELIPKVIDTIKKPYETKPWYIYRARFLNQERITEGVQFWRQHRQVLARAQKKYGVPASVIVAIIGVESYYGKQKGDYPVIDTLSTLAFDYPPRAKFFRQELTHFLIYTKEDGIDPFSVKGSYAGAIGQPQFMPSSFRHYAVDFSGKGKRDLSNNEADVIGSIANYMHKNGWQSGSSIAVPASLQGRNYFSVLDKGRTPQYTLQQLNSQGIRVKWGNFSGQQKAILISLQGKNHLEYWLAFHNFSVIIHYNTSKLYAMAVYQLSEEIKRAYHA